MINEERTYTIVFDDLCRIVGANAAVIAGKVATMDTGDGCEISLQFFMDLLGIEKRTLRSEISRLQTLGYIVYTPRFGRGSTPIFKKGTNLHPFMEIKGTKNAQKRVQKMPPKEYKESIVVNSAPTRDTRIDDLFRAFWAAFNPPKEHQVEFTRCAALFAKMDKDTKQYLLSELRAGKRRKNAIGKDYTSPYLYLLDYKPQIPIWRVGDTDLTPEMVDTLKIIRLEGRIAYCRPQDLTALIKQGAQVINQ